MVYSLQTHEKIFKRKLLTETEPMQFKPNTHLHWTTLAIKTKRQPLGEVQTLNQGSDDQSLWSVKTILIRDTPKCLQKKAPNARTWKNHTGRAGMLQQLSGQSWRRKNIARGRRGASQWSAPLQSCNQTTPMSMLELAGLVFILCSSCLP